MQQGHKSLRGARPPQKSLITPAYPAKPDGSATGELSRLRGMGKASRPTQSRRPPGTQLGRRLEAQGNQILELHKLCSCVGLT